MVLLFWLKWFVKPVPCQNVESNSVVNVLLILSISSLLILRSYGCHFDLSYFESWDFSFVFICICIQLEVHEWINDTCEIFPFFPFSCLLVPLVA